MPLLSGRHLLSADLLAVVEKHALELHSALRISDKPSLGPMVYSDPPTLLQPLIICTIGS